MQFWHPKLLEYLFRGFFRRAHVRIRYIIFDNFRRLSTISEFDFIRFYSTLFDNIRRYPTSFDTAIYSLVYFYHFSFSIFIYSVVSVAQVLSHSGYLVVSIAYPIASVCVGREGYVFTAQLFI